MSERGQFLVSLDNLPPDFRKALGWKAANHLLYAVLMPRRGNPHRPFTDEWATESAVQNRAGRAVSVLDILFLGGVLAFFGLSALAVRACNRI